MDCIFKSIQQISLKNRRENYLGGGIKFFKQDTKSTDHKGKIMAKLKYYKCKNLFFKIQL